MTRLVVHAGTHGTDWPAVQGQLVSWRRTLASAGVHLHPSDDPATWAADAVELAESAPSEVMTQAARSAVAADAKILFLSTERLEDSLRDPTQVSNLSMFARDHEMMLTILVTVRDQLGYLNELYCDRVVHLQMAREFASFVSDPQPAERFAYDSAFSAALGVPDVDFVAVPYTSLADGSQARTLLTAVGIPARDLAGVSSDIRRPSLPGPFLIAANRLLFKRMWRMGMFKNLPRPMLLDAGAELAQHAEDSGWDDRSFWGWTERARREAIRRFREGNDAFAAAAWGHRWGDHWEDGTVVDVDLASSPPALVVDVLQSVDRLIKKLQQAKAGIAADPAS